MTPIPRRGLLKAGAIVGVGLAGGVTTSLPAGSASPTPDFHTHQAGITTPPQTNLTLLGIDLLPGLGLDALGRLMWLWSDDAARLMAGRPPLADTEPELARDPAGLTITFGIGPRVAALLPMGPRLEPLPAFGIDNLQPAWGQTDLVVQICADDQVVVAHAQRMLTKDMSGSATLVWTQTGFQQPRKHGSGRNLMGQVDGSVNPRSRAEFDELIWSGTPWEHGTFLAVRRIEMNLDSWDRVDRTGREFTIGRKLSNGAPLSGGSDEFAQPDLTKPDKFGFPLIDPASHVARARGNARGPQFLRRGYNYLDQTNGTAGLVFLAYAADLDAQFVPVQQRLADQDLLNKWTRTIGSAVYAIWPGADKGDYLGREQMALPR